MRTTVLVIATLLATALSSAQAAVISGKVVSRDPKKPIGEISGFNVEVTRGFAADGVSLGTFPSLEGITLKPASPTDNFVAFKIDLGNLSLGDRTEVTLTFRAAGRTPAVLQVAGNQDQVVAIVLPIVEPTPVPPPPPPPCVPTPTPCYYVPCCPVYYECCPPRRCCLRRR